MDHHDHVNLLRGGISSAGGVWADLGSGGGAFTLALRELVGPDAEIYSVDKDGGRLRDQERAFRARFPESRVHYLREDFSRPLALPPLDGIVMANSLHYFRDRLNLLRHVRALLKPQGELILVEYNSDAGNVWVPYPLSFERWRELAPRAGFTAPQLLAAHPSHFMREIYAAAAFRLE